MIGGKGLILWNICAVLVVFAVTYIETYSERCRSPSRTKHQEGTQRRINTIYTKHSAGKSALYQRTYLKQSDINTTSCATSLIHTHSIQQRLVPTFIAKPDTYFEISRPSYFTTDTGSTIRHFRPALSARIVLHHSPIVNESIYNVG
jgi:hypothetical protein